MHTQPVAAPQSVDSKREVRVSVAVANQTRPDFFWGGESKLFLTCTDSTQPLDTLGPGEGG